MKTRWGVGLLLLAAVLAPMAQAAGGVVLSPEALFAALGQQPTRSYELEDGKGWLFSTPGRDMWDDNKDDPEGGPHFSVEYRGKPLSRISLAVQQFEDDPKQQANNAKVGKLLATAIEAITGSSEVMSQLESGRISGKMAGFVNGYRITASPASGGARFVTLYKE